MNMNIEMKEIETLKVIDYLHMAEKDKVFGLLETLLGDRFSKDNYEDVWSEIHQMIPVEVTDIEKCRFEINMDNAGNKQMSVYGVDNEGNNTGLNYRTAVQFLHWQKWLDLKVELDEDVNLDYNQISAYILHEMTSIGINQTTIQDTLNILLEQVNGKETWSTFE